MRIHGFGPLQIYSSRAFINCQVVLLTGKNVIPPVYVLPDEPMIIPAQFD